MIEIDYDIDLYIDYSPLWETMRKKDVSQYRLLKDGIIENKTLDRLKKNRNVNVLTIIRLCLYLKCTPNDIFHVRRRPDK